MGLNGIFYGSKSKSVYNGRRREALSSRNFYVLIVVLYIEQEEDGIAF